MGELTFRGSWVREGMVRRPDGEVRSGDFEKCGSRRRRVHLLKPKVAKIDGSTCSCCLGCADWER